MPYGAMTKMKPSILTIGLASSALFDLTECDKIFREQGRDAYRQYQEEHINDPLALGIAFPFIRRLLTMNSLRDEPCVEVVLLSKNDTDTGLRVMRSIKHHGLNIKKAVFLQGRSPIPYIKCFGMSLFLSGDKSDVQQALTEGCPSGMVLGSKGFDDSSDIGIRIAFDFDGVIADDESEKVFRSESGLDGFIEHEKKFKDLAHNAGPLKTFLKNLSELQKIELEAIGDDHMTLPLIEISLVTARGGTGLERVVHTMKTWGIEINKSFFLNGGSKSEVLKTLKPHIYFDDQLNNLISTSDILPSVHIPFGIAAE